MNGTLADQLQSHLANYGQPMVNSQRNEDPSMYMNGSAASVSHTNGSSSMGNDQKFPSYKRMAQRRKVPEGELCAVCSDLATGYHYGVASCNGCKTFFRRTIVSEQTFICQYNGNCDVNKNIRCACRHCRFNKCLLVGMDAKALQIPAIQNDRDRIGPTKKIKMSSGSDDEQATTPHRLQDQEIIDQLTQVEGLCQELRRCIIPEVTGVTHALTSPCLLFETTDLKVDVSLTNTIFKELFPASMNDIRMWNIREMRICIEWAKTFDVYQRLNLFDQFALVRNFAFAFNLLNRVFYSPDHGPDKIVFQNGAFIMRQPQQQVQLSGCRPIYTRQMDEIMIPFRKLQLSVAEFATFKAALFFNPDALDLSPQAKQEVFEERNKYLGGLFTCITQKIGIPTGVQKYGSLLMMTASIQNILAQNEENMQVMELFKNWEVDPFVKELCMKRA
ncbi:Nuclear hormone receptor family member nhr-1 [Caenorhabditis elegans]|uniref:Nuclear hormone receptor family member nhr-1 n=2 Tax=Caenorhabditis elegans TaxID=6239 RepID=NHR1_CAEEL|nr:Nuclear hormone receptor family member nhr-1 [Caenorhabditis elegans]Q21878.4 RecName: Full=Nuclear hormone receptor family member nhr-1 [Caenorhabditis elegans]AAO39169.1 nuclear receptor NHR-1 [Caenorhabditis elegans]CCD70296.1 Nuclear hormone receptor family member nhr-1 [Caenorhabditis elegans]|eukprot:NP_001024853.1 Nuclear hormone receptor family member nhr-1 [Caenorhabditis elegans]